MGHCVVQIAWRFDMWTWTTAHFPSVHVRCQCFCMLVYGFLIAWWSLNWMLCWTVFMSSCSHILPIILVFIQCCLKSWRSLLFSAAFGHFPSHAEICVNNIMDCRRWRPFFLCISKCSLHLLPTQVVNLTHPYLWINESRGCPFLIQSWYHRLLPMGLLTRGSKQVFLSIIHIHTYIYNTFVFTVYSVPTFFSCVVVSGPDNMHNMQPSIVKSDVLYLFNFSFPEGYNPLKIK